MWERNGPQAFIAPPFIKPLVSPVFAEGIEADGNDSLPFSPVLGKIHKQPGKSLSLIVRTYCEPMHITVLRIRGKPPDLLILSIFMTGYDKGPGQHVLMFQNPQFFPFQIDEEGLLGRVFFVPLEDALGAQISCGGLRKTHNIRQIR